MRRLAAASDGKAWLILSLLILLLTTGWSFDMQPGNIVVEGQVTNLTPGGGELGDLPVTLEVFTGDDEAGFYTTTLAFDGSFRLDGLATREGDTFQAGVVYQGVDYFSDLVELKAGQQAVSLPVFVYETTEDTAAVEIPQLHVFITRDGDLLQVGGYYLVSNTGDLTYVGKLDTTTGQRATLSVRLPEDAQALGLDDPGLAQRYLQHDGSLLDTEPVPPGPATVEGFLSYALVYQEETVLAQAFDVPVASVVFVLPEQGMSLAGANLNPAGTIDTQMGPALSYTAGPLAAGEWLLFTVVNRPEPLVPVPETSPVSARNSGRELSVGLVALAVSLVVGYLLLRSPSGGPIPPRARPLVAAIGTLDSDFEAGHVPEKTYRRKRRSLVRQIRALVVDRPDDD